MREPKQPQYEKQVFDWACEQIQKEGKLLESKGGPKIKEMMKSPKAMFGESNIPAGTIYGAKQPHEDQYGHIISYTYTGKESILHGVYFYILPNDHLLLRRFK